MDDHDEPAVEPLAEALRDEVVRDALAARGRRGAVVRQGETHVGGGQGDRAEDDDAGEEHRHPVADREAPPGEPAVAGLLVEVGAGPVGLTLAAREDPVAGETEQGREQRHRHEDGDEDGPGGGETHRREERDADDRQASEGDDHRQAGEDDGGARRAHGPPGGLLVVEAEGEVVPVARGDEERVVDADGQAQHEREDRCHAGEPRRRARR